MLISVIVPVYNVEQYLDQCIQSILNQTYKDFELVLINDGSKDNSLAICQKYAATDSRIILVDQPNAGVSAARNKGIDLAKGEWIAFIDSDDWVDSNYLFNIDNSFDWVLTGAKSFKDDKFIEITKIKPQILNFDCFISNMLVNEDYASPWAKFYKSSIIKSNLLKFNPHLSYAEDAVFNLSYLFYVKNEIFVNSSSSYIYRNTENSLSKSYVNLGNNLELYNCIKISLSKFNNIDFYDKNIKSYLYLVLMSIFKSNENIFYRCRILNKIVNENEKISIDVLKNDRIFGITYEFFIKNKLSLLLIILFELNKIRNVE